MQAPDFWTRDGLAARLLTPASWLWQAGTAWRRRRALPDHPARPVICVGNLTVGGAGKTPTALAIGAHLAAGGHDFHFLCRGYGGRAPGPLRVDPGRHDSALVGDEALLLAGHGPCWIARDRAAGARAAVAAGAEVVVLDDGLQNPHLRKDLAIGVFDGGYGIGNGRVLPAGPLRAPLADGLAELDAAVIIGGDRTGLRAALPPGMPVYDARLVPGPGAAGLKGYRVFAFAGIGRPQKFYDTLSALGATVVETRDFTDHHPYRRTEIAAILARARQLGARPVTTEKDAVRLPVDQRPAIEVLTVALEWATPNALASLLEPIISHGRPVPPAS